MRATTQAQVGTPYARGRGPAQGPSRRHTSPARAWQQPELLGGQFEISPVLVVREQSATPERDEHFEFGAHGVEPVPHPILDQDGLLSGATAVEPLVPPSACPGLPRRPAGESHGAVPQTGSASGRSVTVSRPVSGILFPGPFRAAGSVAIHLCGLPGA